MAEAAFGGWRRQPRRLISCFLPSSGRPVVRSEKVLSGKTQTDIVLGVPAMRRNEPDYEAARLANTILGRFGMMGRLGQNVREQLGLAYYSYSTLAGNRRPGAWQVVAGVNPANVERCLANGRRRTSTPGQRRVPDEELENSKGPAHRLFAASIGDQRRRGGCNS